MKNYEKLRYTVRRLVVRKLNRVDLGFKVNNINEIPSPSLKILPPFPLDYAFSSFA